MHRHKRGRLRRMRILIAAGAAGAFVAGAAIGAGILLRRDRVAEALTEDATP